MKKAMTTLLITSMMLISLPAQAHNDTELETWTHEWETTVTSSALTMSLLSERRDMSERHPTYFAGLAGNDSVVVVDLGGKRGAGRLYVASWDGTVEFWRPVVEQYFRANDVGWALAIIKCESGGNPDAKNKYSTASGLFQHLASYWSERSVKAGWAGHDVFDPEANIAVAAWLLYEGGGKSHWVCRA